jgi:glycosyltransferase involved in cell wall biosynthesis
MKIGLIAYYLTSNHSGQTRFLVNIAKGLKSDGHTPIVYSLFIDSNVTKILTESSISYASLNKFPNTLSSLKSLNYSKTPAEKLSKLIIENDEADVYVVIADEAIPLVSYLSKFKTAYISNGDLTLMLLNPEFKNHNRLATSVLERGFVKQIRNHAKLVAKFDKVMANSNFTSNMMAFFYGIPIDSVVYPPIDPFIFRKHTDTEPVDRYVLAMVRNEMDPLYPLVSLLAKKCPIKVVGGSSIQNVQNQGFVSEDQLVKLYNKALFTISPSTVEFYGYSIVESMSCGTPSIAYNNAGARELITNGENGWLFGSKNDFIAGVTKIFNNGYEYSVRESCLEKSKKYTIAESTKALVSVVSII